MPTGTPTEQDGFCWQRRNGVKCVLGKTKRQKIGRLEKPARVRQRPLQERECAQGDHGPPGLAGAPGQDPARGGTPAAEATVTLLRQGPCFLCCSIKRSSWENTVTASADAGMIPGIQLDRQTDGRMTHLLTAASTTPILPSCPLCFLVVGRDHFSPAVKYFHVFY